MPVAAVNLWNERLKNAIIFFIQNDRTVKLTKLMKLLYYLDFGHYRACGRSVTGQEYQAWPKGPVPVDVWQEIRLGEPRGCDLLSIVQVRMVSEATDAFGYELKLRTVKFDDYFFTPREKKLLENVSEIFKGVSAKLMVESTHVPGMPWETTMKNTGQGSIIPYELALTGLPPEVIEEWEEERHDREELNKFFASLP
jgi:uncharacterized phage-associated protein